MSQYRTGTATVTNGSATVTGSGTLWLANVSANDLFVVGGVAYFVSGVSTNTSLTLTAPYAGTTGGGKSYVIHRDFATILGVSVPLMQDGDLETVSVYNRMVQAMYTAYGSTPNGTAATADVTTSATDTTAGRLLKVGDFGLGNETATTVIADLDTTDTLATGFYRITSSGTIGTKPDGRNGQILHSFRTNGQAHQYFFTDTNAQIYIRTMSAFVWSAWQEIYHTGNTGTAVTADVTTSATDTTAGRLLKVGDFGLGANVVEKTTGDVSQLIGTYTAFYNVASAVGGRPSFFSSGMRLLYLHRTATEGQMLAWSNVSNQMAIQRVSGGTEQGWEEIYHTGNLLGTVSQSGGVPTGAVIEAGSNANGSYTKFADGTMICARTDLNAADINNSVGAIYISSADSTWNYPATFISKPTVSGARTALTGAWVVSGSGGSNNAQVGLRLAKQSAFASSLNFEVSAIGRWF